METNAKPRLRWSGLMWADVGQLWVAWRYWHASYATSAELYARLEDRMFAADATAQILPQ